MGSGSPLKEECVSWLLGLNSKETFKGESSDDLCTLYLSQEIVSSVWSTSIIDSY